MMTHGLIKANSLAMRLDTTTDLKRVNRYRTEKGMKEVSPLKPSVRSLENCVCLAIELLAPLPFGLVRGEEFYRSLIVEISRMEQMQFCLQNKI